MNLALSEAFSLTNDQTLDEHFWEPHNVTNFNCWNVMDGINHSLIWIRDSSQSRLMEACQFPALHLSCCFCTPLSSPMWNPGCSHLSWSVMNRSAGASPYVSKNGVVPPSSSMPLFNQNNEWCWFGEQRDRVRSTWGTWGACLLNHQLKMFACRRPTVNIPSHLFPGLHHAEKGLTVVRTLSRMPWQMFLTWGCLKVADRIN